MQTHWISPAQQITGRDHLGVQAVSEHLYAALLPGITNVTDRVRCYAFYPWFVWRFDRESPKKTPDELIRLFRRAECLHSLIGINHELDTGDEWTHGGALVGRDTLVAVTKNIRDGKSIKLSRFSSLDAAPAERYFQNRLGDLGQSYLGPLKVLEVLDGDARQGLRYTSEWGETLATVYEASVPGTEFFKAIENDVIDVSDLHSLRPFCPCKLRKKNKERDILIEMLFSRRDAKDENGRARKTTLDLILDYARNLRNSKNHAAEPNGFLASAYSAFLPDGNPWVVHPTLTTAMRGWATYHRHEFLSLAVQGLFWAGLAELANERGHIQDVSSYAKWFAKRYGAGLGQQFTKTTFPKLIEARRASQPAHQSWTSQDHELALADALLDAQAEDDYDRVVTLSIQIALAVIARESPAAPYGQFEIGDRFLTTYEINLSALQQRSAGTWAEMNGGQWTEWLAANWGLQAHFRVALRKLRYQTQDTFRIVPLDDGLYVRAAPAARWSSPRLVQAFRFLYDLGALEKKENSSDGSYVLSDFGDQLWRDELGSH